MTYEDYILLVRRCLNDAQLDFYGEKVAEKCYRFGLPPWAAANVIALRLL